MLVDEDCEFEVSKNTFKHKIMVSDHIVPFNLMFYSTSILAIV